MGRRSSGCPRGKWTLGSSGHHPQHVRLSTRTPKRRGRLAHVRIDWTFDECYDFCDEENFAYEDSYAARMFRAYGMGNTEEPSMLIGVSTEDRRFRYVMPDHSTAEQRFSGQQFEKHSWRLSDAADGYGSWEDGLEPHVEFGLLVSEGKTAPYPFAVQALLLAGVLIGALSIMFGFGRIYRRPIAIPPCRQ